MIGAWVATILRASRAATTAAVIQRVEALAPNVPAASAALPGMRGRRLKMEALMPWPNLAVTRATVTGTYAMDVRRKSSSSLSVTLRPSSEAVSKVRAEIVMRSGQTPKAVVRLEYAFRRGLTGFLKRMRERTGTAMRRDQTGML